MPRATRKRSEAGLPVLRMRPIPKGRPTDPDALEEVRALLGDAPRRPDLLIEHLHRIQDARGHLSARHLVALATEMQLTPAEVYEVATFYHCFDVVDDGETAPPALTVRVCDSLACELAGAGALIEALQAALGDQVRVTRAPCVGRCDQAPVAVVGDNPVGPADVASVKAAVDDGSDGVQLPDYESFEAYRARGGYSAVHTCFGSAGATEAMFERIERFIAEADDSGLRGLGGAGFPAARKWQFVRAEPKPHYMVVNADEGEPGTFKDRYCLETHPHQLLEGMLIAACAVEADEVFLYVRDEYPAAREILRREIEVLNAWPELNIPRIHMRRGAGAYICGEETGLIESIEGRRGMPRLRPPFPAQNGVFGRPTLVHNVETLYWLPEILRNGASNFAANGNKGHKGKRLFSVSGRVKRPGVYEAPNGVTARDLIDMAGGMLDGHNFYAYLPGGASGGILPASKGDLPLDFGGELAALGCFVGSGAIVILSDRDRARDAALNVMRFFADESCGECTPCRVGTAKSIELMQRDSWDRALLAELGAAMADASICGLGQAAPNPVRCVIEYFPEELES